MEETSLFFVKGLLLGALIAAPFNDRGTALVGRSRRDGFAAGIAAGCGSAFADFIYAALAGYLVAGLLAGWIADNDWVRQFGAMMLLWLGWQAYNAALIAPAPPEGGASLLQSAKTAFSSAIGNPTSLVVFTTIFISLGADRGGADEAADLALGVFLGAVGWGIALAASQAAIDAASQRTINRASAVLLALAAFAVAGGFL